MSLQNQNEEPEDLEAQEPNQQWIESHNAKAYSLQTERLMILCEMAKSYIPPYYKHPAINLGEGESIETDTHFDPSEANLPPHLEEAREKMILSVMNEIIAICGQQDSEKDEE